MSETTGSYSPKDKCEVCETELILRKNWYPRHAIKGKRICIECYTEKKQTKRIIDKIANQRDRLIDNERVERLVGRIKEFNVRFAKHLHVKNAIDNARKKNLDEDLAQQTALQQCRKWTYEDIFKVKQEDHFVMAYVLAHHKVQTAEEGDMSATWHLALHYCGYDRYEVDPDGLPLAKPGSTRLKRINYIRRKADDLQVAKRFGIVAARTLETGRRSRTEWRICLCKTEDILDKVRKSRIARHEGEIKREADLKASMKDTIEASQDIVDQYLNLYNRKRE